MNFIKIYKIKVLSSIITIIRNSMGIKNLNVLLKKLVKNGIQIESLDNFSNQIIAIDTSNYLYKFKYDNGNFLRKFIDQIMMFWKYNITPIYILDGAPPKQKNETLKKRKNIKNKNKNDIATLETQIIEQDKLYDKTKKELSMNKLFAPDKEKEVELSNTLIEIEETIKTNKLKLKKKIKNVISISPNDINNCKNLFNLLGVKYIVADSEADILCAELQINNIVDACMSEDMDFLTHGCTKLLKNYNYRDNTVKVYTLPIILEELNLSYDKFVDVCILCGCDYTTKIHGIGPISALKYINKYGSIENIIQEIDNTLLKLTVDPNFDYLNSRDLFKIKKKSPLEREDVLVGHINYNNLISFLNECKIKYSMQKIKTYRNQLYQ